MNFTESIFGIGIIIIFILLFIIFLLKGENISLKTFLREGKSIGNNIFGDRLKLLFALSIVVISIGYIGELGLSVNVFNSLALSIVLVAAFLIGIAICIVSFFKITKDVVSNFTDNKEIKIKSLVAIIYPIISILVIRIFYIYFYAKGTSTHSDAKPIIIGIRIIIRFGSLIFIPVNLVFNVYKGIKECIINAEFVFKNDRSRHRNIKKIKIAIATTWFLVILVNSTNIVYFFSSIDSNMFKDMTISQSSNVNEFHIMRISSAFYFSLITLLTVGYGDIIPVGAIGRFITSFIAIMGSSYLLIALGSILSDDNGDTIATKFFKGIENKKIIAKKNEAKNGEDIEQKQT